MSIRATIFAVVTATITQVSVTHGPCARFLVALDDELPPMAVELIVGVDVIGPILRPGVTLQITGEMILAPLSLRAISVVPLGAAALEYALAVRAAQEQDAEEFVRKVNRPKNPGANLSELLGLDDEHAIK